MTTRHVTVERISITSSRPFDAVVGALTASVGRPDLSAFLKEVAAARSAEELENIVNRATGPSGLMIFVQLDLGEAIRKETGGTGQSIRLLVGNPVTMSRMARYVPDAGSYAPVTILIDERPDGVQLSYDRMASLLAPYRSAEALEVARDLDSKVEALLSAAAG